MPPDPVSIAAHFNARYIFSFYEANGFGFGDDRIVIPTVRKTEYLAVVHAPDGRVLATPGQPKKVPEDLKWPDEGFNATLWTKDGPFWYALFKFSPTIMKFDQAFHPLAGDAINDCEKRLYQPSNEDMEKFRRLPPHFSDFKAFRGNLYVMCLGVLYRIDASSGKTTGEYHFFGRGASFAEVPKGMRLTLPHFVILDDGTLILSHPALLWDHDLWIADLNFQSDENGDSGRKFHGQERGKDRPGHKGREEEL